MCGIAGAIGDLGPDTKPLDRMVHALRLRGPDDSGIESIVRGDRACWLGNTRLSIQDLSPAGHMPMRDDISENRITYNGEIYNFPALRRELEAEGERFGSKTDTEVILKLYRREGPAFLGRMRGMFAIAVWDDRRGELFLARDRAGKKPLYYSSCGPRRMVFASEIRSLLASGLVEARLDSEGLRNYVTNGFLVSPTTILANVFSLLPGHWMRVGLDGQIIETRCYWLPSPGPDGTKSGGPDAEEHIRENFREAVLARLVSDVPVGVFLSGGMDSSAVVGAMGLAGEQVHTFSVCFPGSPLDESEHSRRVAEHWRTEHTEIPVSSDGFLAWLPEALEAMDQPTFDGINSFFVSKAAHEAGLKVVLSGIGADELFGGYPHFKAIPLLRILSPIASRSPLLALPGLASGAARCLGPKRVTDKYKLADLIGWRWRNGDSEKLGIAFYQLTQILFPSWSRRALLANDLAASEPGRFPTRYGLPDEFAEFLAPQLAGGGATSTFSMLAWRLFLGERCLRDVDSMSMGVSLEVRAPFTDHLFVEKVLAVPSASRCAGPPDKPYEQKLLAPFLAKAWTSRKKQGFVMPFVSWLATPDGFARVRDTLDDSDLVSSIGLDPGVVQSLWKAHRARPSQVPWSRIWSIFVLAAWCRGHGVRL